MVETTLIKIGQPIVNYTNGVLTSFVPGGEKYMLILISVLVGYGIKSKNNWGTGGFIVATIIIYAALKQFGIGVLP